MSSNSKKRSAAVAALLRALTDLSEETRRRVLHAAWALCGFAERMTPPTAKTPRYPTPEDTRVRGLLIFRCSRGCQRAFLAAPQDRREEPNGRGFYVCPCGAEKTVRLGHTQK